MQRTATAKQNTERADAKEQAQLDILAWISDKNSKNENSTLDDNKVKEILTGKSYVKEAKATSFIAAKGEYEIPYSELYKSNSANNNDNPSTSPLNVLIGKQKSEIFLKKSIPIDATTNAHFYDCNFDPQSSGILDDYIEYNGEIYKITYNLDYDGENPYATSIVASVNSTDIDISQLGKNGNNIITIVHGNSIYYDEELNIGGVPSGFIEDTLFGTTYLFPYSEDGVLTGAYMLGNYDEDYSEKGYIPQFSNPTD